MSHSRMDTEAYLTKRTRNDAFSSDDDDEGPITFKRAKAPPTQLRMSNDAKSTAASTIPQFKHLSDSSGKGLSVEGRAGPTDSIVQSGTVKQRENEADASTDSDDDKPLSHRIGVSTKKTNENNEVKGSVNNIDYRSCKASSHSVELLSKKAVENATPKEPANYLNFQYENNDEDHKALPKTGMMPTKSPEVSLYQDNLKNGYLEQVNHIDSLDEDSDDDKPLSQRFSGKPPTKQISKDPENDGGDDSEDEKPLVHRLQRNGLVDRDANGNITTIKKDNERSEVNTKKRPSGEIKVLNSAVAKKAKLSDSKMPTISKKVKESDDEDDIPIAQRMKKNSQKPILEAKTEPKTPTSTKTHSKISAPSIKQKSSVKQGLKDKKLKSNKRKKDLSTKKIKSGKLPPGSGEGQKWTTLEHNGVIFPPPYKPHGVKMLYNGKPVDLTPEQEEVATMFAVMKDTDYATKKTFQQNFWHDWKKILGPKHVIQKLELCDFTPIYEWHLKEKEKKKQMSTEEKKALKEEKLKQEEKYMWAIVDGVKEKVGNFRVEPPGLFRGRGEHPKMGKLKRRIYPEDITINIGKDAPVPECSIPGHRWKEIRHDNTVTWLAYWNDPINTKEFKYVFLAASSSLKGQSDKEKYEKARMLKGYIDDIRSTYTKNFQSNDETKRQIAVATYLIDRLALRAGNEKDDDEADTVGCCTLKVENVTLKEPRSIEFDFLGKDSIRYQNTVEVDPRVYKAIGDFKKGKKGGVDLFDKLDTNKLNAHLKEIMPGLTAKVFRTYNASITLDNQLLEAYGNDVAEKVAAYQSANKEVAILCNHQRSVSKSFDTQMARLREKTDEVEALIKELETDMVRAKLGKPPLKDAEGKAKKNLNPEAIEKKIVKLKEKREKMKLNMQLKDDLKTVALGTSKINYMDPRITVAWCKRNDVPIEKVFNKSLLAKFAWAMDVEPEYCF